MANNPFINRGADFIEGGSQGTAHAFDMSPANARGAYKATEPVFIFGFETIYPFAGSISYAPNGENELISQGSPTIDAGENYDLKTIVPVSGTVTVTSSNPSDPSYANNEPYGASLAVILPGASYNITDTLDLLPGTWTASLAAIIGNGAWYPGFECDIYLFVSNNRFLLCKFTNAAGFVGTNVTGNVFNSGGGSNSWTANISFDTLASVGNGRPSLMAVVTNGGLSTATQLSRGLIRAKSTSFIPAT